MVWGAMVGGEVGAIWNGNIIPELVGANWGLGVVECCCPNWGWVCHPRDVHHIRITVATYGGYGYGSVP